MSLETDFPLGESISVIEKEKGKSWASQRLLAAGLECESSRLQLFFYLTSLITQRANIIHPKMPFQTLLSGLCWSESGRALCACFPAPSTPRERGIVTDGEVCRLNESAALIRPDRFSLSQFVFPLVAHTRI